VLEKYKGKWIAVEEGRVTCAHEDYNTFLDELNKTAIKSPYLCLCGKEDYAFPVVPVNYYDAYLDNFIPGDVQHPDENKALPDFTPYGFFKQSRTRSVDADHLPPPYRPFLTLPIKKQRSGKVVHPVTFLADTGAPQTYICSLTAEALGLSLQHMLRFSGYWIYLGNTAFPAQQSSGIFEGINLLGTDVLYRGVLTVDFERRKLLFSSELMSL